MITRLWRDLIVRLLTVLKFTSVAELEGGFFVSTIWRSNAGVGYFVARCLDSGDG